MMRSNILEMWKKFDAGFIFLQGTGKKNSRNSRNSMIHPLYTCLFYLRSMGHEWSTSNLPDTWQTHERDFSQVSEYMISPKYRGVFSKIVAFLRRFTLCPFLPVSPHWGAHCPAHPGYTKHCDSPMNPTLNDPDRSLQGKHPLKTHGFCAVRSHGRHGHQKPCASNLYFLLLSPKMTSTRKNINNINSLGTPKSSLKSTTSRRKQKISTVVD